MSPSPDTAVRAFLRQMLDARRDTATFSDGELLFSGGRLDSLAAIEAVVLLEQRFGVDFARVGFDMGHIDSVSAIMTLLEGQAVGAGA